MTLDNSMDNVSVSGDSVPGDEEVNTFSFYL